MKKNIFVVYLENFKILKYHAFLKKQSNFLLLAASAKIKMKKYLKKENHLRDYSWYIQKYMISLKICLKQTKPTNLDEKYR